MVLTAAQRKSIQLLRDLKASGSTFVKLYKHADEHQESYSHLEQLGGRLKRAGLVDVRRGPGGGYRIRPEKSFITLLEVINAVSDRKHENPDCEIQKLINDALSRVIVA